MFMVLAGMGIYMNSLYTKQITLLATPALTGPVVPDAAQSTSSSTLDQILVTLVEPVTIGVV